MEIERKFLVTKIPDNLESYDMKKIMQGYLSNIPAIRVRCEDNSYYLTYKSGGIGMSHEEANLPLTKGSFEHLLEKSDGIVIVKNRYLIPDRNFMIELDIFKNELDGLVVAEVEFESEFDANTYTPPAWFGLEVTLDPRYSNSNLCLSGTLPG